MLELEQRTLMEKDETIHNIPRNITIETIVDIALHQKQKNKQLKHVAKNQTFKLGIACSFTLPFICLEFYY